MPPTKPEIMSPAGHWPQLSAAIEAGADAVYFGLKHFSARAKVGFELDELPEVMRTLHRRGVRGYLTFNTLVYENELGEAARALAKIAQAGTDAVIVQDVGIARLARSVAPDLEVHGSTQMSITSAEGVELARRFGCNRVVLARELSLGEIGKIRAQTDVELEMFVHGALCVSYSGQCFSSEAWGGRSANRGQCAQACRLPYELIVDGQQRPLDDARYLLSPGDLYALDLVPDIVKLGISSLKIEGRYKDENYVALTTAAYRKAVDEAWAGLPASRTKADKLQLEQVYSRGLGAFFVGGTNHQIVVSGRAPRHRGVLMGRVTKLEAGDVVVSLDANATIAPLKAGDGIVFDAADWRSPEEREEGGRIYHLQLLRSGELRLSFGNGAINTARIRAGDLVWRSDDPAIEKAARPYTQAASPVHKQRVNVHVVARVGEPLQVAFALQARPDMRITVNSADSLVQAQRQPPGIDALREQLGRLGNTAYALGELTLEIGGNPFVPNPLLNQLRREAVMQLEALQSSRPNIAVHDPEQALHVAATAARAPNAATAVGKAHMTPQLHLLVRTPEQLDAAIALKPNSITLDYLELYGLRPAVERVQTVGITARVASPRVLKPDEQRVVSFLLKLDCEILVRSSGLLQALQGNTAHALTGDFSLNAANALTARAFLDLGLQRITPTYDLNAAQITDLARNIGAEALEVIGYSHLPVFHTEHCVFCRFLSEGTSYKDCGHPCETHRVSLRDSNGREHPVMADVGCRNTVFGAEAQDASSYLHSWFGAGIQHVRLEFVHESAAQVQAVGSAYQSHLAGKRSAEALAATLKQAAPQGTTAGSLKVLTKHTHA